MGIIARQSIYNVLSITLAFGIGAANMLFLYPKYPGKEFQGLVVALLANSNLIQPFISFGVQHTLIKYFSDRESKVERDRLLWFVVLFPLVILGLLFPVYSVFNDQILDFISNSNKTVLRFPVLILSIAIATAYFEIFFSWLRDHFLHPHNATKKHYRDLLPQYPAFLCFYDCNRWELDQRFWGNSWVIFHWGCTLRIKPGR